MPPYAMSHDELYVAANTSSVQVKCRRFACPIYKKVEVSQIATPIGTNLLVIKGGEGWFTIANSNGLKDIYEI